ncbi:hypothetical protein GWI33_015125 [Rhynchophorus ferrugineus]|uniref:Uncharacterized protein n=1 Tax=Rhynchophorus ferrugineus TaxID=354439 RepID=A0A834I021_RHYFE|nr:hypothetical protein GWI33_015125 [Rhynchophorus ferrugineus]
MLIHPRPCTTNVNTSQQARQPFRVIGNEVPSSKHKPARLHSSPLNVNNHKIRLPHKIVCLPETRRPPYRDNYRTMRQPLKTDNCSVVNTNFSGELATKGKTSQGRVYGRRGGSVYTVTYSFVLRRRIPFTLRITHT